MNLATVIDLRFRWDTGGGWLEIPQELYNRYPLQDLSANSRFDSESEKIYLDGDDDAPRFIDKIRRAKGLESTAKKNLSPLHSGDGIRITNVCDFRVSAIRRFPSLLKRTLHVEK